MKHKVSLEVKSGEKDFMLLCDHDASLNHCMEAVKIYEAYILERIKEAEQQMAQQQPEVKVE